MVTKENRLFPRAKIKWPVMVQKPTGVMEGVTLNVSSNGLFIGCRKPLRLNEVFDMVISSPNQPIGAKAEVVWSNIYGPDDDISPRGMGVRFLDLSDEDRQFIAAAVEKHNAQEQKLENMTTLVLEADEN